MSENIEVLIVGGGLAGVSTAYHLSKLGVESILIEAGKIGIGSDETLSGTNGPAFSKMVCTSFESDFESYCDNIGLENSMMFLDLANKGAEMQMNIAKEISPQVEMARKKGAILVGHGIQKQWLMDEIENYPEKYNKNFRLVGIDEIVQTYGIKRTSFDGGVFMPNDAVIDPIHYINSMVKAANLATIVEDTKVHEIKEEIDGVIVKTNNKGEIKADYVVMATNGFYIDNNLKGLLNPRWAFILSFEDEGQNTPNAWDFADNYYYWTRQNNVMHIGGEDRAFEKKYARASRFQQTALEKIKEWSYEKFTGLKGKRPLQEHYGVFAMTPDEMPIVGRFSEGSRVFYIVGCNGMGQSTMTYGASILPKIIGYKELSKEEQKFSELLSPKRESLKQ